MRVLLYILFRTSIRVAGECTRVQYERQMVLKLKLYISRLKFQKLCT